jgi:hypothetical protein
MDIQEFLSKNPSVPEILKFIDTEAQRIVSEKQKNSELFF